jgi:hypothetical protein
MEVLVDAKSAVETIEEAWKHWIEREEGRSSTQSKNVYASQFSPCARQMVLRMTHGHELPPFEAETLAKFRRGNDRERDLLSDLARIGRDSNPPFQVVSQQERFEIRDRKDRIAITGKVDGRIRFAGGPALPFEVKSWNPNLTARVNKFEDLFENRWLEKGGYQLLMYLYGSAQSVGFMLLDRPGLPSLLAAELWENGNHERVDRFLNLAETAMDHKQAKTLPDYIPDSAICKVCPFLGGACLPPLLSGQGAKVFTDEALAQALDRRGELEPAADEFDKLDKAVKKQLRGVEMGVAGDWLIEGKWGKQTNTTVPPEHAALYKSWQETDHKGRFTLNLTRLGNAKETSE